MKPADASPDSDRLNGWKEIAAFLGKGVRTVQRWERDYGLPVRRLGREGGEIVFALRSEIDAWAERSGTDARRGDDSTAESSAGSVAAAAEPSAASRATTETSPKRRLAVVRGMMALAVLAGVAIWATAARPGNPTSSRIQGGAITTFDIHGRLLWQRQLEFSPTKEDYDDLTQRPGDLPVIIDDLDRDGRNEVVLTSRTARREESNGLVVYDADGEEKFRYLPTEPVAFGGVEFTAPWLSHKLWVLPNAEGTRSVWVTYVHGRDFPTRVVALSPSGQVQADYWSNGYVDSVNVAKWNGRLVVLIGATNNENRGASLAVFEYGRVSGGAPAENAKYRCTSCGPSGPSAFFVFPRRCLATALDSQATIRETWVDEGGTLHVGVLEGPRVVRGEGAVAWYAFRSESSLDRVEYAGLYELHQEFEAKGLVRHPFGEADLPLVFPVKRWTGSGFSVLPSAPAMLR